MKKTVQKKTVREKTVLKLLVISTLFLVLGSPLALWAAESCSASATFCQASCFIQAPPGGSTECISLIDGAVCNSFDANGNFVRQVWDSCFIIP